MANHFWRGSVGDYRFGAITDLILTGQRSRKLTGRMGETGNVRKPPHVPLSPESFEFQISNWRSHSVDNSEIIDLRSEILLVDLARLERAASTFAESRSNSIELQAQGYCRL